ncbi:MAG: hypothetical protein OXE57_16190, partial [Alphaproteobacteria bacterium]|nr:hypothetical protein [Alphaproteobacteria bacterium]
MRPMTGMGSCRKAAARSSSALPPGAERARARLASRSTRSDPEPRRAMRLGKLSLAALEAVLRLYRDPDRLAERLPALRILTRPVEEIEAQAHRLAPAIESADVVTALSQIGSGSLPVERLESRALALSAPGGKALEERAAAFRQLPIPVIGRISEGRLLFDLRTLDDEDAFLSQLGP